MPRPSTVVACLLLAFATLPGADAARKAIKRREKRGGASSQPPPLGAHHVQLPHHPGPASLAAGLSDRDSYRLQAAGALLERNLQAGAVQGARHPEGSRRSPAALAAEATPSAQDHDSGASRSMLSSLKAVARAVRVEEGADPIQIIGLAFSIWFGLQFFYTMMYVWPEAREIASRRSKLLEERQKFFIGQAQDVLEQLQVMRENAAHIALLHFAGKLRHFLAYMGHVAQAEGASVVDSMLVEPFRAFALLWAAAFRECSLDPEKEPIILCSQKRVQQARTVADVASIIVAEASDKLPDVAAKDGEAAEALQAKVKELKETGVSNHEDASWIRPVCNFGITWEHLEKGYTFPLVLFFFCLRVTIFSRAHAILLLAFPYGCILGAALHMSANHIIGGVVDTAVIMVAVLCMLAPTINENNQLEVHLKDIRSMRGHAKGLKEQLRMWTGKYDRVIHLWQYQTMNKLDLFDSVSGLVNFSKTKAWDPIADRALRAVLPSLNEKLGRCMERMGSPSIYLGRSNIDEDTLGVAANQMKKSIDQIGMAVDKDEFEHVEKHLDNFFALIVVRIISASRLPNTDGGVFFTGGDLTDAYVLIRMGKMKRPDCPSTRVIKDNLDPKWEEEFCLEVPTDAKKFDLEVFDSDEDCFVGQAREGIGYVHVKFRHTPGEWIHKRENLLTFNQGHPTKSKLSFSFFYVNSVTDLSRMSDEEAGSVEDVGSFLQSVSPPVSHQATHRSQYDQSLAVGHQATHTKSLAVGHQASHRSQSPAVGAQASRHRGKTSG